MAKSKLEMFIDGGKIVDHKRRSYTEQEAKQAWEEGRVTNFNLAFKRFIDLGSLVALEAFYREDEAKRKARVPGVN